MNEEMTSYVNQKVESSILKAQHEKRRQRQGSFDLGCAEKTGDSILQLGEMVRCQYDCREVLVKNCVISLFLFNLCIYSGFMIKVIKK